MDPRARMVGLHLYDGLLKVIPIDEKGALHEARRGWEGREGRAGEADALAHPPSSPLQAFNIRVEEQGVLDVAFLHADAARPTVAILAEDARGARSVSTYEVDAADRDFHPGPWSLPDADPGATALAPLPGPGGWCLVAGGRGVAAAGGGGAPVTVAVAGPPVRALCRVDDNGARWLLGDAGGGLSLLVVSRAAGAGGAVTALRVEPLGSASAASTLAYLDAGVVFVGSAFGDSQLVALSPDAAPAADGPGETYVRVLETFPNLGPIVDMAVLDVDRTGACHLVTASGVGRDGSLRVVRNGVGVAPAAAADLPGVTRAWGLQTAGSGEYDGALLLSFVGATRLLEVDDDDALGDAPSTGALDTGAPTLAAAAAPGGRLLQATPGGVRLLAPGSRALVGDAWAPPAGARVGAAAATPDAALVATTDGTLVLLTASDAGLTVAATATAPAEAACLDLAFYPGGALPGLALVGSWDVTARVLALPSLETVCEVALGGDAVPRSAALATLDGTHHALLALGDGRLLTWSLDSATGALSSRRAVALGSRAAALAPFAAGPRAAVLAACDRPAVVHSANGKLLVSNVNEGDVTAMARFHTRSHAHALALAKPASLCVGTVDSIQRLHVRSVPLGEQPRRLAHQEATRTLAATIDGGGGGEGGGAAAAPDAVRLFDDATFETLDRVTLDDAEVACSIASLAFEGDETPYYVVGTAYSHPDEPEPTRGRLLVFAVTPARKLERVAERPVRGAAYCVAPFRGRVLAGVNSRVSLYAWATADDGGRTLDHVCSHAGHVLALYLATRGGTYVAVGDLMRSIQLLAFRPESDTLESVARDYHTNWMTAVDALDDDTYVGAENSYNLFAVRRDAGAATDDDRARLDVVAEYHVGEFINRFASGSLVMRPPEEASAGGGAGGAATTAPPPRPRTLLYGTIGGVVGVLAVLTPEQYAFFDRLQACMRRAVRGVGGFDHAEWRAFASERATAPARGVIDGDLVEQFLELPPAAAAAVAAEFGGAATSESIAKAVDELSRACH